MKAILCLLSFILYTSCIPLSQRPAQISTSDDGKVLRVAGVSRPSNVLLFGYWKSRQNPKITVYFGSSPMAGASLEIYSGVGRHGEVRNSKLIQTLVTDDHGQVVLPHLHCGRYHVVGRSKPNRENDFYLKISPFGDKSNNFDLYLYPVRGSAEWVFETFEKKDHVNQVSTFRGVIKHFEAPVPDAEIDVFAKTLGIDQQPLKLRTNSKGEFSANLPEGQYVVHVWNGVWETLFQIEISPQATRSELLVGLCPIFSE